MAQDHVDFETCARLYWQAPPELQRVALQAWYAALRRERKAAHPGPRLTLREVAGAVGKTAPTLHRLGVPRECGLAVVGGRRTYTVEEVEAYLVSPTAGQYRERLRAARRIKKEESNEQI